MAAVLKAEMREAKKSVLRKLRREGFIPAVLYGDGIDNQSVYVDEGTFSKVYRDVGRTGILTLEVQNESYPVMVYDVQYDKIKNNAIHIDFFKVNMDEEVDAEVPIQLVGQSPGEKEGGVIQQNLLMLNIRALPANLPSSIEVSIDQLNIGDSIAVSDLKDEDKYTILNAEDEVIVTVLAPSAGDTGEASEEEAEAAEGSAEESSDE